MFKLKQDKTCITGKPGVGKTTLIQTIIRRIGPVKATGFITTEIRSRGSRVGFELQGLDGQHRILAHVNIDSPHRVGKYGVDTDGFDEFLETLDLSNPDAELIVIDEIGKMELFSEHFRNLVRDVLNADKQVLATIPLKGNSFIRDIKKRKDVCTVELTLANRHRIMETIVK